MISAIRLSLVALYTTAAMAQHVVSARAGTVYFVDGDVTVDSQQIHAGPTSFPVLKEGELLQTARGWAEVLLAPGVFLRLGDQASVRMLDSRLENTEVVLENGTALVEVVEIAKNSRIQIRLGEASTSFKRMGLYRFESKPAAILVFGGEAEVRAGGRQVNARRGAAVKIASPLSTFKFDPGKTDVLHQWAARRSFQLFASNRETVATRTHWEFTASGWMWNRDFQVRFFSPLAASVNRRKLDQEEADRAGFRRTEDLLRMQDQQKAQRAAELARQAPPPGK